MEEIKYTEGTVTLSTREYRDLITESVTNEQDARNVRSEKWNLESKLNEANKKLNVMKEEMENYRYFFKENSTALKDYNLWLLMNQKNEEHEDD